MPGDLPQNFELSLDSQFHLLLGFSRPPRAGRITAILGSGQVTVSMDDPDGGSATAWPLNGFTYAVDDVIYVLFAANNPDSGIVIGSKGSLPTLDIDAVADGYVRIDGTTPLTADWNWGHVQAARRCDPRSAMQPVSCCKTTAVTASLSPTAAPLPSPAMPPSQVPPKPTTSQHPDNNGISSTRQRRQWHSTSPTEAPPASATNNRQRQPRQLQR